MARKNNTLAVNINNLKFHWPNQAKATLEIENFAVTAGEHLFIQGASGSGKSTLLNIICGVLAPQNGEVELLGQPLQVLSNSQKDRFRADHLGIVFQQFNLLPYLTAQENIQLALNVSKHRMSREQQAGQADKGIIELLAKLGIDSETAHKKANQLSIGQQQRIAVARALIGKPEILIADEPTSALDSDSRDRFLQQLFDAAKAANTTIIFVSHDQSLQQHFSRSINLADINKSQPVAK